MFYMIVELPSGFINEYGFLSVEDALIYRAKNQDCKFGDIRQNPILDSDLDSEDFS